MPVKIIFVPLFLFLFISFSSADIYLTFRPAAEFYSDGVGYNAGLSFQADLYQGLYGGADVIYESVAYHNNSLGNIIFAVEAGYHLVIIKGWLTLSPFVIAGEGFVSFYGSQTYPSTWGFYAMPGIVLQVPLGDCFTGGIYAGYSFYNFIANSLYDINARVSISFRIETASNAAPGPGNNPASERETLREEIGSVLVSNQSAGNLTPGATNEVRMSMSDILFELNSSVINPQYEKVLDEIALRAKNFKNLMIVIEGYTDNTGEAGYNQALSEKRAESVAGVFTSFGISPGSIRMAGYGSGNPIAPNDTEENRAKNRRVVIRFIIEGH